MLCEGCGFEAAALKTVRWRTGERRFVLCDPCWLPLRCSLWIVPGEHDVHGKCRGCGYYFSLNDLREAARGAGKRDVSGLCPVCSEDRVGKLV